MNGEPRGPAAAALPGVVVDDAYRTWIARHAPDAADLEFLRARLDRPGAVVPRIHLVVADPAGDEAALAETMESLAAQNYPALQVTIVSALAPPAGANAEGGLLWVQVGAAGEVVPTVSGAAQAVPADWVGVLGAGDRLDPRALLMAAGYIGARPGWRYLYVDEDVIDRGQRYEPWFKPDFNLEYLRSMPYVGAFALVQRDCLVACGGLQDCAGLESYDLLFRVLDAAGAAAIGHLPTVLYHQAAANRARLDAEPARNAGRAVVARHLARRGIAAAVQPGAARGTHFVDYRLGARPLVSIIVPTRDRLDLIQPCLDSLLATTGYRHFEVIVMDNGSSDPAVLEYFARLRATQPQVRIEPYPHPYNFSAINNAAARLARGEFLVLLNNDTAVQEPAWLERMLALGVQPDVGVVGCRLLYPDGRIQHAGVVAGMTGTADHPFMNAAPTQSGHMRRLQVAQDYSAVTAACLLVRKSVYTELGGLDEERFRVLFNDIDFCFKVRARGLRVVWTPFATLMHHGSSSLKREQKTPERLAREQREGLAMYDSWKPLLADDPAYNRNLSLRLPGFRIENAISARWDPLLHDRPRVLAMGAGGHGAFEYRALQPLTALERAGRVHAASLPFYADGDQRVWLPHGAELERLHPDVVLMHNCFHNSHLNVIERYRRYVKAGYVFGLDDLVTELPATHANRARFYQDMPRRLRYALSFCDRLVVSTEPLAEALRGLNGDIRVVPNALERRRWGALASRRGAGRRPRVGWVGAGQHAGDLALLREVVPALAGEVEWVFMGMCLEEFRPHVHEFHPPVPYAEYPARLAALDLDLALAPLEHNRFNACKSNLRLLEYGAAGWPVIATDIEPYRSAPVTRVPNQPRRWLRAIREHLADPAAAAAAGERLRAWVLGQWMLEDRLDGWESAITDRGPAAARHSMRGGG